MVAVQLRENVIKKDIVTVILALADMIVLAQMVIRARRLRYAVVGRVPELVINVVRIPISIVVMVWGKQVRELLVTVNIPHVTAQVVTFGIV